MFYILAFSIALWLACFAMDKGSKITYSNRGGGGSDPEPPPPPPPPQPVQSAGETTEEIISAQIAAQPKIYETQAKYAPKYTQLTLDQLLEFGPQFSEFATQQFEQFGPRLAESTLEQQRILDPSRVAASEALTNYLEGGPENLSPEELAEIQKSVRSASSARGLGYSGLSAQEEVNRIFGARQALRTRYINTALSASGRLPASGGQVQTNPASYGPGQVVSPPSAESLLASQSQQRSNINAYNSSIYGTQASIYNSELNNASSPFGTIAGGIIGGGLGLIF